MPTNFIYPFGQAAVPPAILDDATYAADSRTTNAYGFETIIDSDYTSKATRQSACIAAGVAQFLANYNTFGGPGGTDITDDLSPATISSIILNTLTQAAGTTQPKQSNNQQTATTEYVQENIGNFAAAVGYSADQILTLEDVGKAIYATANNVTFTLPLIADVLPGSNIFIRANSFTGIVVQRQSSNVIGNGTAGDISFVNLAPFDVIRLTSIGSKWHVTGGNEQLNTSSQFRHSLTTNGYAYKPGDMLEQWGYVENVNFANAGAENQLVLPEAWPTGFLSGGFSFASSTGPFPGGDTSRMEGNIGPGTNPLTHLTFYGWLNAPGATTANIYWWAKGK